MVSVRLELDLEVSGNANDIRFIIKTVIRMVRFCALKARNVIARPNGPGAAMSI
jgi:hypothetical protein